MPETINYVFFLFFSLTVEHEQIQKRTFTNWINAQLAKVCWKVMITFLCQSKKAPRLLSNIVGGAVMLYEKVAPDNQVCRACS